MKSHLSSTFIILFIFDKIVTIKLYTVTSLYISVLIDLTIYTTFNEMFQYKADLWW
jgi:hypothetical protein